MNEKEVKVPFEKNGDYERVELEAMDDLAWQRKVLAYLNWNSEQGQ